MSDFAVPPELDPLRSERRLRAIRAALAAAFASSRIALTDQSHLHVGHAGARDGRGHFDVAIVSEEFAGLPMLARHRRVYAAVGDLMNTDIHALSIRALAPTEAGATEIS